MTAEAWVQLLEEMVDLKLQQFAETTMKLTPELTRLLQDKRETDRRRLQQIRTELVRTLQRT
jgi:3-phenylpropionate/cinnamic acid dioxygenase small subunit